MLRPIGNARIAPRLIGVKATSSGGATTVNIGLGDFHTPTSEADGRVTLQLKEPYSRAPIVVGAPMSGNVGNSGSLLVHSDPTVAQIALQTHDGSAGDDGSLHALAFGWDSYETDYYSWGRIGAPFNLRGTWAKPRILRLKVTGHATTPAVNIGNGHVKTLTRNGAGDYTLTFKNGFGGNDVVAVPFVISSSRAGAFVVSADSASVRILTTVGGSGSDLPFYLLVMGSDTLVPGSQHRRVIHTPERLARAIALHITFSGGTPSLAKGTGEVTLTDTATGKVTINFAKSFAGEPLVLANKDTAGNVTAEAAAGVGSVQINCWNTSDVAADPADLHVVILGTQDSAEYYAA